MKKLQVRLTFDGHMGPFFSWLVALPEKSRARELMSLARTGYAVVHGVRLAGSGAALHEADAPPIEAPGSTSEPPHPRAPGARDAAVETFGA